MGGVDQVAIRLLQAGEEVASGSDAIDRAARLLRSGEVVAIPTDTVYGLAASLQSGRALQEIFTVKGRAHAQTLPVLIPDHSAAGHLLLPPQTTGAASRLLDLADRFWPGGLTVALPARAGLPPEVVAVDGTVGLRVPDNTVARTLLRRTDGALAVTSANRSGHPPLTDADAVLRELGARGLTWVLDGGPAGLAIASTVVGQDGDRLVTHRQGAIAAADLRRSWADITGSLGEPAR